MLILGKAFFVSYSCSVNRQGVDYRLIVYPHKFPCAVYIYVHLFETKIIWKRKHRQMC